MKRISSLVIMIVLGVVFAVGLFIFLRQRQAISRPQEKQAKGTASNFAAQNLEVVPFAAPQSIVQDTDNDRLSDEDERRYGTDPAKPDTDGDGLSDWYEVDIYGTDPLKTDTDGDSFSDSQEVRAGYDPRSKEPRQLP